MAVVVTRDLMRRIAARTGYPYYEAWSKWNKGVMRDLLGAVVHHTGSSWNPKVNYRTLPIVRDGRSGLENSLSMFGLGLDGGTYLINDKVSWHAGDWSLGGNTNGNGTLAGIEAESEGVNWTPAQRDAYPRLVASILLETKYKDRRYTGRHADGAMPRGRKTDAGGLDMNKFWAQVDFYLAHPAYIHKDYNPGKGLDMSRLILAQTKDGKVWLGDMIKRRQIQDPNELQGVVYWLGQLGEDATLHQFADIRVIGEEEWRKEDSNWVRGRIAAWFGVSDVESGAKSPALTEMQASLARVEAAVTQLGTVTKSVEK